MITHAREIYTSRVAELNYNPEDLVNGAKRDQIKRVLRLEAKFAFDAATVFNESALAITRNS